MSSRVSRAATSIPSASVRSPSVRSSPGDRRKRRIELTFKTKFLHFLNSVISSMLFLAYLERLEFLADAPLLDLHAILPYSIIHMCKWVLDNNAYLIGAGFLAHILAMKFSPARVIFTELASLLAWPILYALESISFPSAADGLVYKILVSALLSVLSTSNMVAPRKRKHVKRPNNIISSAFSVASTPNSQCSSITSSTMNPFRQAATPQLNYSQWIDDDIDSPMDTTPAPPTLNDALPDLLREGSVRRECTPFTEISGRLDLLSLGAGKENDSPRRLRFTPPRSCAPKQLSIPAITPSSEKRRRGGPFSSLSMHGMAKEFQTPSYPTILPPHSPFRASSTTSRSSTFNAGF